MTLWGDPPAPGRARRFARIYREKRRDQAPHSPFTMRMARRHAAAIAWHQSRGLSKRSG